MRLLHRSTRKLTLTEAGRTYLEACQRILAVGRGRVGGGSGIWETLPISPDVVLPALALGGMLGSGGQSRSQPLYSEAKEMC